MSRPQRMDGYIRVSRVGAREGPGYISPSVQREQIEGWAKLRQVEIAEWHEDFDQSGGKLSRPGLDALLARIEAKQTEGVIVAKLDRLSRLGVPDALKLVERITSAGATLAALDLGIDPTTPTGELMLTLLLAMARMERRRLTESWAIARQRAVERGAMVSPTPYGYQRNENGCLEPHPVEAMHMRRAYEIAVSQDARAATNYLAENSPGRAWTVYTVRRMLKRRVYLGESQHGENLNPEAHEPLVDRSIWAAAQHEPRTYVRSSEGYPLSGIAVCGTCKSPMVAGPRSGGRRRRYRCSAAQTLHKGPRCPKASSIVAEWLEQHVVERVRPYLEQFTLRVADGDGKLALVERALIDAEAELDEFASDLTLRRALGSKYANHRALRVEHVEQARDAYQTLAREAQAREHIAGIDMTDLDDPLMFAELLRGIGVSAVVSPGRGNLPERVRILPFDDECAPGEPDGTGPE